MADMKKTASGTRRFIDKKNSVKYALMARPGNGDEVNDGFTGGSGASDAGGSMMSGRGGGGGSMMSGRGGSGGGSVGGGGSGETGNSQVWMRTDRNHRTRDFMAEAGVGSHSH